MTTERQHAANRRNARLSTGPRSAAGKARVKQNALRHGLNVAVANDPHLTEEIERIARAIGEGAPRGGARPAPYELSYLARRVAEAQVDLMRVRRARHAILTRALDNPRYRSPRYLRRQIAMLVAVGELLIRGIAVPDDMRKAAFARPQGALKFALVITDLAQELARFDRYERRALSRRKVAVAAFDAACAGQGMPVLIELPAMASPPDREARCWRNKAVAPARSVVARVEPQRNPGTASPCARTVPDFAALNPGYACWRNKAPDPAPGWRNKATATAPSAPAGKVRAWGDRPTSEASDPEAGSYACQPLDIDRQLRLDLPRDGPGQ